MPKLVKVSNLALSPTLALHMVGGAARKISHANSAHISLASTLKQLQWQTQAQKIPQAEKSVQLPLQTQIAYKIL